MGVLGGIFLIGYQSGGMGVLGGIFLIGYRVEEWEYWVAYS